MTALSYQGGINSLPLAQIASFIGLIAGAIMYFQGDKLGRYIILLSIVWNVFALLSYSTMREQQEIVAEIKRTLKNNNNTSYNGSGAEEIREKS